MPGRARDMISIGSAQRPICYRANTLKHTHGYTTHTHTKTEQPRQNIVYIGIIANEYNNMCDNI